MPDEIIIDGLEENAFRRSIEAMLRHGRADEAASRLRTLLPEFAGEGKVLPARMLEITADQLEFAGWDRLAGKIGEYSRAESPITAVGIGICDPEDSGVAPDEHGNLKPPLETTFYSDATFPFSESSREDLLEGYSSFGCEWQGDHDRADHTLSLEGMDDLYGAIAALENRVSAAEQPSARDIRAGALGACYLGVLVYQAARNAAIANGLPRPLTILLVNSDAYPFFDAPVMTCDEYLDDGQVQVVERPPALVGADDAGPVYGEEPDDAASLIGIGALARPGSAKKMALALEAGEAGNILGMADELVAQAAFDPDSIDISRFLPRTPAGQGEQANDFDADAAFGEPEFPVGTNLAPERGPDGDPSRNAPAAPEPRDNPYLAAPEPPVPQDFDRSPEIVPDRDMSEAKSAPEEPATGIWADPGPGIEFPASPSPQEQPASHSIRSRIRITSPEEDAKPASGNPLAAIAQWFGRVRDFLLRR